MNSNEETHDKTYEKTHETLFDRVHNLFNSIQTAATLKHSAR